MAVVERLAAEEARAELPGLVALLRDAVASGASVGFLDPLGEDEARAYWSGVMADVEGGTRILLVARGEGGIVGTAQIELATKPNAAHRAEVQRVLVLRSARNRGIGRALMDAVETQARSVGRALLVLDTRQGDAAERLYRRLGYVEAGVIPGYARSSAGTLDASVFFYKALES